MTIYNIPYYNMETLEKKLSSIKKKCEKYGTEFIYEKVGEYIVDVPYGDGTSYPVKMYKVNISGIAKKNGWTFVGSIEQSATGNIIRTVANYNIPEKYYNCELECDHCHTSHFRKQTYLVEKNGEFKQVGSSCLKDYTGIDAENVAWLLSGIHFAEISQEEPNDILEHFGNSTFFYITKTVLAYAFEVVKHFGYVKASEHDKYRTCDRVSDYYKYILYHIGKKDYALDDIDFEPEKNLETVENMLTWLKQQEENSLYIHNLKVMCENEYIEPKELNFICSLPVVYMREVEKKEKENTEKQQSEFVGTIGEKITFDTKVKLITSWINAYGMVNLYRFEDNKGNIFIWKTNKDIVTDSIITITGTIKNHSEYNGIKQNELTRCKVL